MVRTIFTLFILMSISTAASAKLYKCTDEDGAVTFSDTPCASTAEVVKGIYVAGTGDKNDDIAIENCVAFLGQGGRISDPEGVKVQSHRYEWVTVRDIGARRMLHLLVNVPNQYGAYDEPKPVQCLLMGDGLSVNTNDYELVQ
jgi:hypothetical protein